MATAFDPSRIEWRRPWLPVSPDFASKAEAELLREVCAGHVLYGCPVKAIGHRQDCDDVLFYLGETSPEFAVVHLTYQPETLPQWPGTTLFDSLEAWINQCMAPDAPIGERMRSLL
jgi:hypothetical protein